MQNITNDDLAMAVDTPESRRKLMASFSAGNYVGRNDAGEQVMVSFSGKGMTICTNQSNGWIRVNRYDSEGYATEETYEGRWKAPSPQQEKPNAPDVLSWNKLMAAIKDAKRVEYEVDAAKSVLYFMSDHFGLILVDPNSFAVPMRLGKLAKGVAAKLKEHQCKATDIATDTRLTYSALHGKGNQKILVGTDSEGTKYPVFIPAKLWDVVDGHETIIFTNGSVGTVVVASEMFFAFIRPTKLHDTELSRLKETLLDMGILRMNYAQLNADFTMNHPVGSPTGRAYWFEVKWVDKRKSLNDLLRDYLKDHGIPYINTVNGEVWFLFDGDWTNCTAEVDENTVKFYMMEFELG